MGDLSVIGVLACGGRVVGSFAADTDFVGNSLTYSTSASIDTSEIGRASRRERVQISVVAVSLKKNYGFLCSPPRVAKTKGSHSADAAAQPTIAPASRDTA